ncbi:Double-stranded RNA-binding protein 4 [Bienertia sinuspersici]
MSSWLEWFHKLQVPPMGHGCAEPRLTAQQADSESTLLLVPSQQQEQHKIPIQQCCPDIACRLIRVVTRLCLGAIHCNCCSVLQCSAVFVGVVAVVLGGIPEHLMYKNRLQEFAQRASIPFPIYYTVNEKGPQHFPQFRSTVEVDGDKYACLNTFSSRKAAEQDAAKIALEGISEKIKNCISKKTTDGGFPPVYQDKVFCKSILNEFAEKKNIEKPKYDTIKIEGLIPVFVSSLVFNGVKYAGQHGVNKKEAEQLAARAAILSILANPGEGMHLSEIVKSKAKLFSAVHENICAGDSSLPSITRNSQRTSAIGDSVGNSQAGDVIQNVVSEVLQGQSNVPPKHEFKKPGLETCSHTDQLPIVFVPSTENQIPLNASTCGVKRKPKKKKKANKRAKTTIE